MPILEDAILGQDCSLTLESASFTGEFVQWDNFDGGLSKTTTDFNTAQSTTDGFVTPKKRADPFTIRIKRGLNTTFKDIKQIFDDETITNFEMTDWPDHAEMVEEYGPLACIRVSMGQGESFGTADLQLRYGYKTHGYTPA